MCQAPIATPAQGRDPTPAQSTGPTPADRLRPGKGPIHAPGAGLLADPDPAAGQRAARSVDRGARHRVDRGARHGVDRGARHGVDQNADRISRRREGSPARHAGLAGWPACDPAGSQPPAPAEGQAAAAADRSADPPTAATADRCGRRARKGAWGRIADQSAAHAMSRRPGPGLAGRRAHAAGDWRVPADLRLPCSPSSDQATALFGSGHSILRIRPERNSLHHGASARHAATWSGLVGTTAASAAAGTMSIQRCPSLW
jgi:hypothetical protein